jgi:hypothetical protein
MGPAFHLTWPGKHRNRRIVGKEHVAGANLRSGLYRFVLGHAGGYSGGRTLPRPLSQI